jgi:hypothetical protein
VIRQLCYAAANNLALGWPGTNADIFKATVKLLSTRHARTFFFFVDSNANDESRKYAYALAKDALKIIAPTLPFVFHANLSNFSVPDVPLISVSSARKVVTDLPETSPPRPKKFKLGEGVGTEYMDKNHWGRAKVHALKDGLRKQLLACENNKEFWDFVRKRTDPHPKKIESYGDPTLAQL